MARPVLTDQNMEIIPYDNNRNIVLRHDNSLVLYDPKSQQMMLRRLSNGQIEPRHNLETCSTCGQRLPRRSSNMPNLNSEPSQEEELNFVTPGYFRKLQQSLPGSTETSHPPSPRRRLVEPVRTGISGETRLSPGVEPPNYPTSPTDGSQPISSRAFTENYFEKFFIVNRELGHGGRGIVLLVEHVLDGVHLGHFACKRVPVGDDHEWLEKVLVEVQALQNLSHQNLVSYRHVWLQDTKLNNFGPSVPCAFILQQFCNGGDLHNYILGSTQARVTTQELKERMRRKSKGENEMPKKFDEPKRLQIDEIYSLFRDITSGLRFLHLNGYIHRDLKPSNCLLHTIGSETRVLVSDFGEIQYENALRNSTGATGTISYCAPEVLQLVTPGGSYGQFTFKSDIFSLGMILYFLCFASLPHKAANVLHEDQEDIDHLRAEISAWAGFDSAKKLRTDLPSELYMYLKRLLATRPEERPSAREVEDGIRSRKGLAEYNPTTNGISVAENISPAHRIVRIDSPAPSKIPNRQRNPNAAKSTAMTRSLRNRAAHIPISSATTDESAVDIDHDDNERPRTTRNSSQDLILRHQGSPPPEISPSEKGSPEIDLHPPLLLPPSRTTREQVRASLLTILTSSSTQSLILILKFLSLLQPCASRGTAFNPSVVYPTLLLALSDFLLTQKYRRWVISASGIIAHCFLLYVALSYDTLCTPPVRLWDAD